MPFQRHTRQFFWIWKLCRGMRALTGTHTIVSIEAISMKLGHMDLSSMDLAACRSQQRWKQPTRSTHLIVFKTGTSRKLLVIDRHKATFDPEFGARFVSQRHESQCNRISIPYTVARTLHL